MFLNKWKSERNELTAKKAEIDKIYLPLKDETANIERIRKNVCEIIQAETQDMQTTEPQNTPRKKYHGMEI